jgi:phenylpropionate dioxygenase-like ring-hydroxylating dioxygenase large terminal subunit
MTTLQDLSRYVVDDPARGVFRVHRDIFHAPEIFELEMAAIFERTWIFLAMEPQLPRPFDFVCATVGRQPVILIRNAQGALGAFFNSCRHKGARLAYSETGNAERLICPYHAWTYDADGRNCAIKDARHGHCGAAFEAEDHDLVRVPRLASYRGLVFASLDPDVPALEDWLGDLRPLIDLVMDQGEHGMELVPGRTVYSYAANWKLQAENGMDPYHLTSTHPSFIEIISRRQNESRDLNAIRSRDFTRSLTVEAGCFTFPHGHGCVWNINPVPEQKPLYESREALRARVGDFRAEWMLNLRNLTLWPSVQLADSESLLLRVIRPIAVNRTEMRLYCMGPVGEAPAARARRIRQHEDFFNVSGLATPDDTTVYEACQFGFGAQAIDYHQGYARGTTLIERGPNALARQLGINPVESLRGPFPVQQEIQYLPNYREWRRLLEAELARRAAGAPAQVRAAE